MKNRSTPGKEDVRRTPVTCTEEARKWIERAFLTVHLFWCTFKIKRVIRLTTDVEITKSALKGLERAPRNLQEKFAAWVVAVQHAGLQETRKRPGWHDEPLKGDRKGQRSIRLNKQWRAIYILKENGKVELIEVIEVTPHAY